MSFTAGIPASGQSLGSSRLQVLNNFASLRSTIAVNHVDVNSANPGTHTHADLLAQSADPNPATGLVSHYSKTISGVTEWFFQRENSGAVIQMSAGIPAATNNGTTFLPGGVLLKWGTFTIPNFQTSVTVTFKDGASASPFPNNCFVVNVTSQASDYTLTASANFVTVNGFFSGRDGNTPSTTYYYSAIGN